MSRPAVTLPAVTPPRRWRVRTEVLGALLTCLALQGCRSTARAHRQVEELRHSAAIASSEGNWDEAAEQWAECLEREGENDPATYVELARALWADGRLREANHVLTRGVEQFPGCPELRHLRGKVLCERGFRRSAESEFLTATELAPSEAQFWFDLAAVQFELGLSRRSLEALQRYESLAGQSQESALMWARALREDGQLDQALLAYQDLFNRWGLDIDLLLEAASSLLEPRYLARLPEFAPRGIEWTSKALAMDPNRAQTHYLIGCLHDAMGEEEQAVRSLARAVELDSSDLSAMTRLAVLHARRGNSEQAESVFDQALAVQMDSDQRDTLKRLRALYAPQSQQQD